ncbi:LysR family transcriptional regulator [Vibrio parahaemolyticus]|nr:LysR family transcriptional regulator [Vibrio parahaemolyticus]HCM1323106.1 LysR family transcriptional regulator [Vibrio parahaemolyticus]HCM1328050.1 LysR family transcriptional regulator [Vibrio parahaemolyticus]
MDTIDGFKTIVAVVETGSFTAAGERLGMSKSLVSKYVNKMEKRFSIRLFNRSTRQISLTSAGKGFYKSAIQVLDEYTSMIDSVHSDKKRIKGKLRISTSVTFGERQLSPKLPEFIALYPDIELEVHLTNRRVDILQEGFDVIIRISNVEDSNLIAREISSFSMALCASKTYLQKAGVPKTPLDLTEHKCIVNSNFKNSDKWTFSHEKRVNSTIDIPRTISVNSPRMAMDLANADCGIAMLPSFIVEEEITSGNLCEVLPDFRMEEFSMYVIYPHRKYLPKKVRCFVDFICDKFGE